MKGRENGERERGLPLKEEKGEVQGRVPLVNSSPLPSPGSKKGPPPKGKIMHTYEKINPPFGSQNYYET